MTEVKDKAVFAVKETEAQDVFQEEGEDRTGKDVQRACFKIADPALAHHLHGEG
jgi:hypothetical protein